jgi:hypothetical protein
MVTTMEKKDPIGSIISSRPSMWLWFGAQKLDEKRLYFFAGKNRPLLINGD